MRRIMTSKKMRRTWIEDEEDMDFDSFGDDDEEDGYYDDEPEDMLGHQVEDRNPSPCNPAYAVEARMELL